MILIIDGNNYAFRTAAIHSLTNDINEDVTVMYGFIKMLQHMVQKHSPEQIFVCWDYGGSKPKKDFYPDYKGNRKHDSTLHEEVSRQIKLLHGILPLLKVQVVQTRGVEADDIIWYISKKLSEDGKDVLVTSSDQDLLQCINTKTSVYSPARKIEITLDNFRDIYGVEHKSFVDYKALVGDTSDNIKGVEGIGKKTASDLLTKYGSIVHMVKDEEAIEHLKKSKRTAKILDKENIKVIIRNLKLMKLGHFLTKENEMDIDAQLITQRSDDKDIGDASKTQLESFFTTHGLSKFADEVDNMCYVFSHTDLSNGNGHVKQRNKEKILF